MYLKTLPQFCGSWRAASVVICSYSQKRKLEKKKYLESRMQINRTHVFTSLGLLPLWPRSLSELTSDTI